MGLSMMNVRSGSGKTHSKNNLHIGGVCAHTIVPRRYSGTGKAKRRHLPDKDAITSLTTDD